MEPLLPMYFDHNYYPFEMSPSLMYSDHNSPLVFPNIFATSLQQLKLSLHICIS